MAYQDTTQKIFDFLKQLQPVLQEPKDFNLKSVCQFNNIPTEYGKMCIDKGLIIRVGGGKRGRATYRWNKEVEPTEQIAEEMVDAYNSIRKIQTDNRYYKQHMNGEAAKQAEILKVLVELKNVLEESKKVLEKIAENTTPESYGVEIAPLMIRNMEFEESDTSKAS